MKVLIAGASGALGRPLSRQLRARGYEVLGITQSARNVPVLTGMGVLPVVADVLDRDSLLAAVHGMRVDAVVHALTALKKIPLRHHDMDRTDALRDTGMANLLAAARAVGAQRLIAESMHLGYGYGDWGAQVLTEAVPFAPRGRNRDLERHLAAFRSLERRLFDATRAGWIEGISLRFGAFYGPEAGMQAMIELLQRRRLPLVNGGTAVLSWVHLDDAAAAVIAALERGNAGEAYNVVDDEPVSWRDFLGTLARTADTPQPRSIPRFLVSLAAPNGAEVMSTTMRVSNAKAKGALGWVPTVPTYRVGLPQVIKALSDHRSETAA